MLSTSAIQAIDSNMLPVKGTLRESKNPHRRVMAMTNLVFTRSTQLILISWDPHDYENERGRFSLWDRARQFILRIEYRASVSSMYS